MSEWISVEDRLPNRDCNVIVYAQKVKGGLVRKERFVTIIII